MILTTLAIPSSDLVYVLIWCQKISGKYKYEIDTCSFGTKVGKTISEAPHGLLFTS